ncbi:MAG: HIRAN domain-containing protein [Bacteroidales bacterium]|nr:HIRAN domain-containing protein [Bacteroidales bacterium]
MITIEYSGDSEVYVYDEGTDYEKRLEWTPEENKQSPPFSLEKDILSYVKELESVLAITKGEDLPIVEKRYRGMNTVLARMVNENEGYVWDIEVRHSDCGDLFDDYCSGKLYEGGITKGTLEAALPQIKNLVDTKLDYVKVRDKDFFVSNWWLEMGEYELFPGVIVFYHLWQLLDREVKRIYDLFEKIGNKVADVTPAHITYRIFDKFEKQDALFKQPEYAVTGIRYHLGDDLTDEEKTAAAEQFLAELKKGQKVVLVAERDNPFDNNAIAVYMDYKHIGYIAKEETDEVRGFLDKNGHCDAVVERSEHVTLFITIPATLEKDITPPTRPRLLPQSPLGENVMLPFRDEERRLQMIASRMTETEVEPYNFQEIIQMAELYAPLSKLSICHEDALWRNKISKMLHRIYAQSDYGLSKEDKDKVLRLYKIVNKAVGDMRRGNEHGPEEVFVDHLNRLRNDEKVNHHLYEKYCSTFLDGKDFTEADRTLVDAEYRRLLGWLHSIKWCELRNPHNLQVMGKKVDNLGLSRRELYDLYSVLLLIEKLEESLTPSGIKEGTSTNAKTEKNNGSNMELPSFEEAIPEIFRTGKLFTAWVTLKEEGFLDDNYHLAEDTPKGAAKRIVELFDERFGKGKRWVIFEELWGLTHLRQYKGKPSNDIDIKLSKIFREL